MEIDKIRGPWFTTGQQPVTNEKVRGDEFIKSVLAYRDKELEGIEAQEKHFITKDQELRSQGLSYGERVKKLDPDILNKLNQKRKSLTQGKVLHMDCYQWAFENPKADKWMMDHEAMKRFDQYFQQG